MTLISTARLQSRRLRALERMIAEADEILDRTTRIVRRLMPDEPAPHGFRDPAGFVASCRRFHERERLFWEIKPRIAAKVKARFNCSGFEKDLAA